MTTAELLTVTPDPGAGAEPCAVRDLARVLETHGVAVRGRRVVAAEEPAVEGALREAVAGGGLVLGLGEGDGAEVLRRALARLLGARLVLSDRALGAIADDYAARGRAMPRRAEALALVPQGASVLVPEGGGEPGLLVEPPGAVVVLLPLTPAGRALLRDQVMPRVLRDATATVAAARTLRLVGLDLAGVESRLASVPGLEDVTVRALEVDGELWVRLSLKPAMPEAAAGRWRALDPALREALGVAWYGSDDETLETVLGTLLRMRGLTLAVAESCTGGLVGHRLTQVPGSSAYFERGLVVYSNAAKQALLGVPEAVLARHGAVSAECAEAMARGVREQARTDLGLSLTGIAGPEGGTPAKPVGTVFVGLADARGTTSRRYRFGNDRQENKALSATMALDWLRRRCLEGT